MPDYRLVIIVICSLLFSAHARSSVDLSFNEEDFEVLSFSSIEPNQYTFTDEALKISVDGSASPLIYPIDAPQKFQKLQFTAKKTGALNLKTSRQGSAENDDFSLKIGLVFDGDKTLNFFQRAVAASWITTLHDLAPVGTGISKIHFYSIYQDESLANTSRQHPLSDLLYEEYVGRPDEAGNIKVAIDIEEDKKVLAVWISADGDDTQSKYQVELTSLSLE